VTASDARLRGFIVVGLKHECTLTFPEQQIIAPDIRGRIWLESGTGSAKLGMLLALFAGARNAAASGMRTCHEASKVRENPPAAVPPTDRACPKKSRATAGGCIKVVRAAAARCWVADYSRSGLRQTGLRLGHAKHGCPKLERTDIGDFRSVWA